MGRKRGGGWVRCSSSSGQVRGGGGDWIYKKQPGVVEAHATRTLPCGMHRTDPVSQHAGKAPELTLMAKNVPSCLLVDHLIQAHIRVDALPVHSVAHSDSLVLQDPPGVRGIVQAIQVPPRHVSQDVTISDGFRHYQPIRVRTHG